MRRMRLSARAAGLVAVLGSAALVVPLLASAPAQAQLIPKADLKVVKTVANNGPTIDLNPTLSDTGLNAHLEWVDNGLRVRTEKDLDSCVPTPPNYVGPPCADFFEIPEMRVREYVDTSTPLSDVVRTPPDPLPFYPPFYAEPTLLSPQQIPVVLEMRLFVDFTGDGVADIELVRGFAAPFVGASWSGFVPGLSDVNGFQVPSQVVVGGTGTLSDWVTTLTQVALQYPNSPKAMVTAFGFGIPRNVPTPMDLTVSAIEFAGERYELARAFQPSTGAAPGATVTYQITITNDSTATKAAAGVQAMDVLPPEMTYVPDSLVDDVAIPPANPYGQPTPGTSANCAFAGQVLTCAPGTLSPGATRIVRFQSVLDETISTSGMPQTEGHWVDVQHNAAVSTIPIGQTRTTTVACPTDYLATDGGLLLDQAGSSADIVISSSKATTVSGKHGWAVEATNLGDSLAEVTAQVTCLAEEVGSSGGHTHAIAATSLGLQQVPTFTTTLANDGRQVQRTCPVGYTPFAPQFDIASGTAVIRESYAVDNVWYWVMDHSDGTDASFGISCLAPRTLSGSGHTAQLVISVPDDTISVGSELQTEGIMACPGDSSAITGGYGGYTSRVRFLGAEPRGESYMFRFYNEEDTAQNADIQVTCVGGLTANEPTYRDILNTAYVTTTTKDRSLADNSSEANVAVSGTPGSTRPSGVTLNPLTAERVVGNNKTTALKLTLTCTKSTPCSFTVKAFSGTTLVANKTTTIARDPFYPNSNNPKIVTVPTTNAGKSLTFGDTITVKIKTTAGTTSYPTVGVVGP